jgi:hypothetical protein
VLRALVATAVGLAVTFGAASAGTGGQPAPRVASPALQAYGCHAAPDQDRLTGELGWPVAAARLAEPCQADLRNLGEGWERNTAS